MIARPSAGAPLRLGAADYPAREMRIGEECVESGSEGSHQKLEFRRTQRTVSPAPPAAPYVPKILIVSSDPLIPCKASRGRRAVGVSNLRPANCLFARVARMSRPTLWLRAVFLPASVSKRKTRCATVSEVDPDILDFIVISVHYGSLGKSLGSSCFGRKRVWKTFFGQNELLLEGPR